MTLEEVMQGLYEHGIHSRISLESRFGDGAQWGVYLYIEKLRMSCYGRAETWQAALDGAISEFVAGNRALAEKQLLEIRDAVKGEGHA